MIRTGSQLWSTWVESRVLRPQDYDQDLVRLVQEALGDSARSNIDDLPNAMDGAGWTARDLLRALYPALLSFSGMLRELLRLYTRVDAHCAGVEQLRVRYEFEEGDQLDDELEHFRECVNRVAQSIEQLDIFRFTNDIAWRSNPFKERARALNLDSWELTCEVLGYTSKSALKEWPFSGEVPTPDSGDLGLSSVIAKQRLVVATALQHLQNFGTCLADMVRPEEKAGRDFTLYIAATDFWPHTQIMLMNLAPQLLEGLSPTDRTRLLAEQSAWLEHFWQRTEAPFDQVVSDVEDVLSLPQWGRRHDMYSAWLVAAMDKALEFRLKFDVPDGVLSFPFRPTLLARLTTASGGVELWTERRFAASAPLCGGRKRAIQPDFTFLDAESPQSVIAAVEAKQYLRARGRQHGETVRDYARNLPDAHVFLVGHGALGASTIESVPASDQRRVSLCEHVRPGHAPGRARFESDLASLFPALSISPLPSLEASAGIPDEVSSSRNLGVGTIALTWDPAVSDLDLHLIREDTGEDVCYSRLSAEHAELSGDGFDGGPECAIVLAVPSAVRVEVHLYSNDASRIYDAAPIVAVSTFGLHLILTPQRGVADRIWHVATIEVGGWVRVGQSIAASFGVMGV